MFAGYFLRNKSFILGTCLWLVMAKNRIAASAELLLGVYSKSGECNLSKIYIVVNHIRQPFLVKIKAQDPGSRGCFGLYKRSLAFHTQFALIYFSHGHNGRLPGFKASPERACLLHPILFILFYKLQWVCMWMSRKQSAMSDSHLKSSQDTFALKYLFCWHGFP